MTDDQTLAGITILADLTASEMRELEQACAWKHYAAGEQVIDRRTDSRDVYFIVAGQVRIANYSLSGQMITFDDLVSGDHFGELAALDGEPRSATVVVVSDSVLASLSPERFLDVVRANSSLALALMRRMARVIRASTDRIMELSTLGAQNRVHAEILRLAKRAVKHSGEAAIKPSPLHADLASRVSTTRETVSRVINGLERRDIVERSRHALTLIDMARLEKMVEDVRGD